MATSFNPFSYTNTGPGEHAKYLKSLRQALDAGEIDVNTFLQLGQPVATEAYKLSHQLGGQGSGSAKAAQGIMGVLAESGFKEKGSGESYKILPDLPSQYQEQVRESLLPPGLTPEQKQAYLKEIPQDIQFGSDQYNLEKEGIRQRIQQEETLGKQKSARESMLSELTSLLNKNAETQFDRAIPQIAEAANTAGIYRSTGFGEALAKQRKQLEEDTATTLGKTRLELQNADINTLADITSNAQGFQTAGLQRQFSLDDFEKQAAYARELAEASKPQEKGKTKTEKAMQGVQLGLAGANTAAQVGKAGQK